MEVERAYRDEWSVPQTCCVCGEPNVDGKPYATSVTLDSEFKMTGATSANVSSKWVSITFPRCARCVRAITIHDRAQAIGGTIGAVFGIAGISAGYQLGGGWLWGCASGLVMWIAVTLGVMKVTESLLGRGFDEDMWRRTRLSSSPVILKKVSKRAFRPELRFTFGNDEYGEAFSAMNP